MSMLAATVAGQASRWRQWARGMARRAGGESGQTMVEYGLILALVAVVVVGAIVTLGGGLHSIFQGVNSDLG